MDGLLVQVGALPFHRSEKLLRDRLVDDPDDELAGLLKPDGDCEAWIAVGEIRRAVERIDKPAEARLGFLAASLFGYDRVLWKVRPQQSDDGFLRPAVG